MNGKLPLVGLLLSLAFLFAGERIFGPGEALRTPLDVLAVASLLGAFGRRAAQWAAASGATRAVLGRLLPAYAAVLVAVVVYGWAARQPEGDARVVAGFASLVLGVCGFLPALFMEISLRSMVGAPALESRRLLESGMQGLALALGLGALMFANVAADQRDDRIDFRTLKTLDPSPEAASLARNLSRDVRVTLFFPPANDVLEQVQPYFEALGAGATRLQVQVLDRDANPGAAKEMRARKNGTIVLSAGDSHESIVLDVDADKARRKLKELDGDVQEKLSKLARDERVIYFTSGHGERSTSPRSDEEGYKLLKEGLKKLNYKVKKLGIAEGLAEAVPDDATIVVVAGPTTSMLESEQQALVRYLQAGGALLLLLDPEAEQQPDLGILLGALGLTWDPTVLVSDKGFVQYQRAVSDRGFLSTNRFTSHDSSRNLSKNSSRVVVLFNHAGSLDKGTVPEGASVEFTVRSMTGTWADVDGDYQYDEATESKKVFQVGAAVQLAAPPDAGVVGGRAVVFADADVIGDLVLANNAGNNLWISDGLQWLEDAVDLQVQVAEKEDVRILHTQEEDRFWFWGTTLGMPLLVFAFGAGLGRLRRRKA